MIDDKQFNDLARQVIQTEDRAKSNTKRLDEIERDRKELSDSLTKMATAVEVLATEQRFSAKAQTETKQKVEDIDAKVSKLELAPAKSANRIKEEIVKAVITVVVGAIIGAIFALILK